MCVLVSRVTDVVTLATEIQQSAKTLIQAPAATPSLGMLELSKFPPDSSHVGSGFAEVNNSMSTGHISTNTQLFFIFVSLDVWIDTFALLAKLDLSAGCTVRQLEV